MTVATLPAPGLHRRVPFAQYLSWDAMSSSRLRDLDRSAAYCRMRIDAPNESTPAQLKGSAKHAAVLEPDLFELRYAMFPMVDRRTKAGKAAWAVAEAENLDKEPLRADVYQECIEARDAVHAHPIAREIIAEAHRETSLLWIDPDHGIDAKARFDLLWGGVGADLKFMRNATDDPHEFWRRVVAQYGTHRQAAHYLDGLAALGRPAGKFLVIAVQQDAPFEVCVFEMSPDAIRLGREHNRRLREVYAACVKSGEWPGFTRDVIPLDPPDWAMREMFPEEFAGLDTSGLAVDSEED